MRDLSGQTFGSYRLEDVIGRGGMGEVYRARHLRLTNRLAAVKVLPASLAIEPDFLQRFEHEANSAASLDHPAILPVWDYGEQGGQPYLAMPYVPGGSVKEYLEERGALDPAEALALIAPIAEALDYAHGKGIIHRDVKPANILLREDGRPLLADFGIAKAVEAAESGLTRAGSTIGTPEYMAPEQIEGKAEPRSDLYSLGVVIFQMLTGQVPYEGGTPYEIAYKQLHTPLPPVRWFRQDLTPALEQMLTTALAKDPSQRYPNGRALIVAFREALSQVHGAATVAAPLGSQATRRLETVGATTPLGAHPPPPPRATAPPPGGPMAPVIPPQGQHQQQRARGVPVGMIIALVALSIVAATLLGVYINFLTNNDPPATPSPNAAATLGVQRTATARANQAAAATGTAVANAGAAAQATFAANTTATAEREGQQNATATAEAVAQNAATATTAASNAANATGTANVAATANAAATGTIRAGNAATATIAANATATAQTAAAQTATVAARPTATALPPTNTAVPPTATAAPPTQTPRPPTQTPNPPTQTPAANWGPALPPLNGGKGYTDGDKRFSFNVPNNWNEREAGNSAVSFGAPNGQATMAVDLNQASNSTTIEDLNTGIEEQVAKQNGYAAVSLDKVIVNGRSAYRRVYRFTSQGQQVQVQLVYFLDNNRAHILTFACRVADFEQFAPTFNGIAGTYKVGE